MYIEPTEGLIIEPETVYGFPVRYCSACGEHIQPGEQAWIAEQSNDSAVEFVVAQHTTCTDEQISLIDALDYAIFCINTFMHPEGSTVLDIDKLESNEMAIRTQLIQLRSNLLRRPA